MERNKETLKIFRSIHAAETTKSLNKSTNFSSYLKYLSFSHLRSIGGSSNSVAVLSLKLWYTSLSIYFLNFVTVILNFHLFTFLTAIPSFLLLILAPFLSFWSIHFQLIRFQVLESKVSGYIGLICLSLQALLWSFMALGLVSGASGGVLNVLYNYSKNWLVFSSSLINLFSVALSLMISIFLMRKIIKMLLL